MEKLRQLLSVMLIAALMFCGCAMAEGDWTNVLLLGCDSYTTNSYQRSDSMIILSMNIKTMQVKMTSIMRDTWIKDPVTHASRKLTELCSVGGPERTIEAINKNFGMDIEKYVLISMNGMAEVIDLLGGIDIEVTEAERKALNKGLFDLSSLSGMEELESSGFVHLNGNQATAFARIRKIDSDYKRTERQRTVLIELAKILKHNTTLLTMMQVISVLSKYIDTNMSLDEIVLICKFGLSSDLENIEQFRIPADGTYESGTYGDVWCIKPNFKKNTQLLHDFIYAE